MRRSCLIVSTLCLAGCMASNSLEYSAAAETNLYHIARVRKGMSEREVLRIMHKPYSYESFQVDDEIYDVWFYVTQTTGLGQTRMVPQNLTPLTFKNGVLVGTGYYWYYYAMKAQAEETAINNPPPPKKKTQDEEDKEFEDALKSFPKQPAVQPAKAPKKTTYGERPLQPCESRLDPSIGMSEGEVGQLMGDPARTRSFEISGDFYDVWFYETVPNKTGKPSIIPQKAKPYIFKNALLVSMSEDEYLQLEEMVAEHQATMALALQDKPKQAEPEQKRSLLRLIKPYKAPVAATQKEISKLKLGMSPDEVQKKLGDPIRKTQFKVEGDEFEGWLYEVGPNQRVPITFKNGKLAGTTQEYYVEKRKEADPDQIDGFDREGERGEEDDSDQNFNYW